MFIFFSIVVFAVVLIALSGIRVVRQQSVAIVETLGKYSRTMQPGFNWIFFPFQNIVAVIDLRIVELKNELSVKTKDNQFVSLPVSIMVTVNEIMASDSFYRLHDPQEQISTWVLNAIRGITSQMTLEELYSDRTHIVDQVQLTLRSKLDNFGYSLEAVLVDQPSVSAEVQHSFNRVVAARREQEAATAEAEASRIKTVANAEAEAEGQRARAKGLADSRKILADGLAESIGALDSKISSQDAINILLATNRIDALRDVGKAGNLVLADMAGSPDTVMRAALLENVSRHKKESAKAE